jgi:DNA-binding response OmpR family regulator
MVVFQPHGLAASVLSGRRVLIVDDDSDWRCLIRSVLEMCEAVVSEAESVEQAKALLDTESVDLIISDIEMPNEDGFALLREVRARPSIANTPIIAWSARSDLAHRAPSADSPSKGFDLYLGKPLHPSTLIERIAALMSACSGPALELPGAAK